MKCLKSSGSQWNAIPSECENPPVFQHKTQRRSIPSLLSLDDLSVIVVNFADQTAYGQADGLEPVTLPAVSDAAQLIESEQLVLVADSILMDASEVIELRRWLRSLQ